MSDALKIDASGLSDLRKYLKTLPKDAEKTIALIVAGASAEAEADAKRLVPVDDGNLRKSIYSQQTKNPLVYEIGATEPYAPYVEFGTGGKVDVPNELVDLAIQYKRPNLQNISQEPQPYLYPAVKLARIEILERLKIQYPKQ